MAEIKNSVRKKISATITYLQRHIKITEVILFGSYAAGTPHRYSDIDIAVVSPDFDDKDVSFRADIAARVKINCPADIEVHPIAYKNLKNARPTNFLGHILRTGKVVYKNGMFM